MLLQGCLLTFPLEVSRVPVPYQKNSEPPEISDQNLHCLGGRRSIVGNTRTKGMGMIDPGSV